MTPRKLHQQALYLEPGAAELLDQLSAESRIPKAALLREAVDDLLSKNHKGVITPAYLRMRAALKSARTQLAAYRRQIVERKLGIIPLRNCDEALARIDQARATIGD